MKVITRKEHSVEIGGVEYELRLCPDGHTDVKHRKLPDGRMVIGYLLQDGDCANPLEDCDGMGRIHSLSNRHINNISYEDAVSRLDNHMAVPLSYFEHGLCKWDTQGSMGGMPDFQWDGVSFAGVWEPDSSCVEHIKSSAIEHCLPDGVKVEYKSIPEPDGTVKDGNSNLITLTMPDGWTRSRYKSFESAYRAAAKRLGIKLTAEAIRKGEQKVAMECAGQACESYTSWCNGDCWGVVAVTCNPDGSMIDSDECWGYVGSEYAEQELKERMESIE